MRHGSVYVGILIAAVVLIVGVAAFHGFMRYGRMSAYRSLHGEQADALARAGLKLTQAFIAREIADPKSAARKRFVAPLSEMRRRPGLVEVGTVDLAARFPEALTALTRGLPKGAGSVSGLEARFGISTEKLAELPDLTLGDRTIARGEREKRGVLFIECTAHVSTGGLLGTVSRSVRAYHEFRVAAAPVPLLSDFTLFSEQKPSGDLNDGAAPLVLNNGAAGPAPAMASRLDVEFLKGQGWVHLGGATTALNLADGPEDFQFFLGRPGNPRAGRTVVDPETSRRANAHLPRPFWEIRAWDAGTPAPAGDIFREDHRPSRARLCGAGDQTSPTVVFGDVRAGFLRTAAAAAARGARGAFDAFFAVRKDRPVTSLKADLAPQMGRLMFAWSPELSGKFAYVDPTRVNALLERPVSDEDYRAVASGHKTRNYNQGLLHLKAGNADPRAASRAGDLKLPTDLFADDAAREQRAALPRALLPAPWSALDGLDLGRLQLAALAPQLEQVCCWTAPASLRAFLESRTILDGGRLDLGTSVKGAGTLELPALTEVARGGLLIADDIVIQGGIARPDSGVLVLVARKSIRVSGGAPVHASLICLGGSITFDAPAAVTGNVAAARVDLAAMAAPGAALAYDTRLKERPFGNGPTETLIVDFARRPQHVE